MTSPYRNKRIEVALPLDAINKASATEKSRSAAQGTPVGGMWAASQVLVRLRESLSALPSSSKACKEPWFPIVVIFWLGPTSCDPQIVARLLVALLQIERNDETGAQPQRQRRQRLANGQNVRPGFEERPFLLFDPATRGGVECGVAGRSTSGRCVR